MPGWTEGTGRSVGASAVARLNGQDGRSGRGGIMIMSVAACLLAGCGDPVAPLQAGQAVEPGVVQASVAETPYECREVTFTITGPETVVGQWPDSTCQQGLKVIPGAPMEWQEEGGRRLRMIVRYVNLTGVAVGLPLDVMLPVGNKFPLDPPTAAHSTMVPLEFDSLGINGRTWWALAGPAGVLGVGDTSRVDTLLFQIQEPVLSARFRFNHYPVEAAVSASVPMQAPDSKPPWFGDDSTWTQGGVRKWAVGLRFLPGATQAQRDAAVTSARGQVVGGLASALGGEGLYYIRLPWAFEVDSLIAAVTLLDQQPGVKFAILLSKPQTLARLPTDGMGWMRTDWALNPDSSSGLNWVLEDVGAPLAWACEIGQPSVAVGVVDRWFRTGDFAPSVVGGIPATGSVDTLPHGTYMASIIGASADNDVGMAGVSWKTGIFLEATGDSADQSDAGQALSNLIARGARVVLLSMGARINTSADSSANQDSSVTIGWARFVADEVQKAPQSSRPLLVVAAGNDNRDAFFSGAPALAEIFPNDVIVVGASTMRSGVVRDRWGGSNFTPGPLAGSNHGPLVDIYAPGEQFPIWDDLRQSFATLKGTSVSAPVVAGIAALLASFDPTLSNAEIKSLILQGAANGGRPIQNGGGKFLVNAYESLKLASDKPGTPICGKTVRTVSSGGQETLVIDRSAGVTETLVPSRSNTGSIRMVSVAQGGRKIATMGSFSDPQYTDVFTLGSGGAWTLGADSSGFMIQFLEQDTAYLRVQSTAARTDLFVRIGSTVQTRKVDEIMVTAAGPTGPFWADWSWEWPSVSPTGDWVLFNWIHDTTCDEVYTIFAVPLRGGGSPVEALRSSINWCSTGNYPAGFTWFGPTAWRADGRAFVSPRQAMPSDPSGPIDMSIRQFSVSGSGISPTGTSATILNRVPRGAFWESDGGRIRIAEQPKFGSCEVTARAASNTSSVLAVLGPCNTFPYVGASLRAEEGPAGGTSGRPGRRMPPWAAVQTSIGGIPFEPR